MLGLCVGLYVVGIGLTRGWGEDLDLAEDRDPDDKRGEPSHPKRKHSWKA